MRGAKAIEFYVLLQWRVR